MCGASALLTSHVSTNEDVAGGSGFVEVASMAFVVFRWTLLDESCVIAKAYFQGG